MQSTQPRSTAQLNIIPETWQWQDWQMPKVSVPHLFQGQKQSFPPTPTNQCSYPANEPRQSPPWICRASLSADLASSLNVSVSQQRTCPCWALSSWTTVLSLGFHCCYRASSFSLATALSWASGIRALLACLTLSLSNPIIWGPYLCGNKELIMIFILRYMQIIIRFVKAIVNH